MSKKTKKSKKKKFSLKKRNTARFANNKAKGAHQELSSYTISYDPIDEPIGESSLPEKLENELGYIFEKCQTDPGPIIDRLIELIEEYPHIPTLYNFISVAYSNLGNQKKAKHWVLENYKKNSDYLFAKLGYAEICLNEGNFQKVPEIFDKKFDLKLMYPERDIFHITEVVGFLGVSGTYFALADMWEPCKVCYESLLELDPDHPSTKRLQQLCFINSIKENFKNITGQK